MIIRPYSEAALFAAGGKCEATVANFPSLVSFFKFSETSGSTITDSISNLSHTDETNIVYSSVNGGMACNIAAGTAPTSGAVPNPADKDMLFVGAALISASAVGTVAAQTSMGCGFGSGTASLAGAIFANNTAGTSICSFRDDSTTVSSTALSAITQDVKVGVAFAIDRGTILQTRRMPNATGAIVAQTSAGNAQATNITGSASWQALRFSGIFFGYAVFYFSSGLPTNWEAGAAWMAQQWINGNKWIYPGFKRLT